jgi:hypothetical protein
MVGVLKGWSVGELECWRVGVWEQAKRSDFVFSGRQPCEEIRNVLEPLPVGSTLFLKSDIWT